MVDFKKIVIFLIVTFKLLIYIINETVWNSSVVSYILLFMIILLSIPYILKIKFNKKFFIKTIIILLISFLMFILYKEDNIFLYAILALITLEDDNKQTIKTMFYSAISIFILTIFFAYLGILPMKTAFRPLDGQTEIRMSLGFPHANAVFSYFLPISLAGIYLYGKNKKFNFLIGFLSLILYYFTRSRTGFYLIILSLGINWISETKLKSKRSINPFIICFIISILLAVVFGTSKSNFVNSLLSCRPWYYLKYLKLGPLAWGHGVPQNIILDNLYLKLLANYHIIGLYLYYYIFKNGSKKCKDLKIFLPMTIFLLYGIFEAVTVINFVIVVFLKEIFKNSKEANHGKN